MKRQLTVVAALLLGIASSFGQYANQDQIRFKYDDTTKIKWSNGDGAGVRTYYDGQLIIWYQRDSSYSSANGINILVQTPDGDSTLSGILMMGDGKMYMASGQETKIMLAPGSVGANIYGNLYVRPDWGATYPYLVLKSSTDSTWLTMATNGLPQWNRALNLPNSWPASPGTGDFGRSGDILRFRSSGGTYGFDFGTPPSVGMGWRWNGTNWAPGYPDTSGAGGGGGSTAWDSLTAPADTLLLNMSTFKTTFSYGEVVSAPAFRITSTGGGYSDALLQVDVGSGDSKNVVRFVNSAGDGVTVLNDGTLQVVGGGKNYATGWKGTDTVWRTGLPAAVAYKDSQGTFTASQRVYVSSVNPAITGANASTGYGVYGSVAGATGAGVGGVASGAADGVYGGSSSGYGVKANSASGVPLGIYFASALIAQFTSSGLIPNTTGTLDLGSTSKHFRGVYADSVFIGSLDSTDMVYPNGKRAKYYHGTFVFGSDTVTAAGLGIDSTYDCTWHFIGKPGMLASPGGKCYNDGSAEFTSSTGPMIGTYVWFEIKKRNYGSL